MGLGAENVKFVFHGQNSATAFGAEVTLHFGNNSIDEPHAMGKNAVRALLQDYLDDDESGYNSNFETWFDANASTAAAVYKSGFVTAAWNAFDRL